MNMPGRFQFLIRSPTYQLADSRADLNRIDEKQVGWKGGIEAERYAPP
jgi:hypothetical protein